MIYRAIPSYDIDNLVEEIASISEKEWNTVESDLMDLEIHPRDSKVHLTWNYNNKTSIVSSEKLVEHPEMKYIDEALVKIFMYNEINSLIIINDN